MATRIREDVLERLEQGIAQLTTSEAWIDYLHVQARFYRYSPNNCMLIQLQMPDASRVAGYGRWRDLGRQVRKGEKGIAILAPCIYKSDDEPEAERAVRGFRTAHVFDVSQTEGEPLAELPISRLSGEAPAVMDALTSYAESLGYAVTFGTFACASKNGQTSFLTHTVTLREDLSPSQTVKTMCHELGHILLEHLSCDSRSLAETEAESVAFVICDALGIDSGAYSFAYLATWNDGSEDAVARIKASALRIQQAARQVLTALDEGDAE